MVVGKACKALQLGLRRFALFQIGKRASPICIPQMGSSGLDWPLAEEKLLP